MSYKVELRNAFHPPENMGDITLLWTQLPEGLYLAKAQSVYQWVPYMDEYGTMVISRTDFKTEDHLIRAISVAVVEHTELNDLVVDPFCGTGNVGIVALEMGRRFYGCDISEEAVKLSNERLKGISQ